MLKKIISLFSQPQAEELSLKQAKKLVLEKFNSQVKPTKDQEFAHFHKIMEALARQWEADIVSLENAQLHNPDIPQREVHFMKGNRDGFIKGARRLKQALHLPKTLDSMEDHFMGFDAAFLDFRNQTERQRYILVHFFEEEVGAVLGTIAKIHSTYGQYVARMKIGLYSEYQKIMILYTEIDALQKRITSNQLALHTLHVERKTHEAELSKIRLSLKKIQSSPAFADEEQQKAKEKEVLQKMDTLTAEIHIQFSKIERALRKYERMSLLPVTARYLSQPVATLLEDKGMEGSPMLEELKRLMVQGSIEIKNSDKVAAEIQSMIDHHYFSTTAASLLRLQEQLTQSEQKSYPLHQECILLERQINDLEQSLKEFQDKEKVIKEFSATASFTEMKTKMETLLSTFLGRRIIITDIIS